MAWYTRSKLGWDMFRNLAALGSKQLIRGKALTSICLDVVGFKKKSSWGLSYYYASIVMGLAATNGYLSNLETIPYSKRTRVLLVPRQVEKALTDYVIQLVIKKEHEGKILPATHPTSVRVGLIAKNIIDALQRDLRGDNHNINVWGYWKFGNIKSRAARYLEHVNWEVLVVDDDPRRAPAEACGAGTIVVYTALFKELNSDAEIAAVIGHEVAHVVARHTVENWTKGSSFFALETLFDMLFNKSAMRDNLFSSFIYNPLRRKLELEADYIGLLLMASAGYDPRVGVKLAEKYTVHIANEISYSMGEIPHPKKRLQILSEAQDEAMNFYRKSKDLV